MATDVDVVMQDVNHNNNGISATDLKHVSGAPAVPANNTDDKEAKELKENENDPVAAKNIWLKKYNDERKAHDYRECGVFLNTNVVIQDSKQLIQLLKTHMNTNATDKRLDAYLSMWINTVIFPDSDNKRIDDVVKKLFSGESLTTSQHIQEQHAALRSALESLKQTMETKRMFQDQRGNQRRERLDCVLKNLDNLYVRKLNEIDLHTANKMQLSSRIQTICSVRPSIEAQQAAMEDAKAKYSSHANVLEAILDKIATLGIVRINGQAYEPIYTDTHQFTYTYKIWGRNDGEIEDLVMFCVYPKEENPELWGAIFDKPGIWQSISRIIQKDYDTRFPIKIPQREYRSWRNGIYDSEKDRFYPWDSPVIKNMPDLVCCMYIDQEFKNDEYEYIIQKHGWRALDTPEMDAICKVQEWSQDECDWWYACLGRMMYPLGKHDNWDRVVYHMGRAGCGKSRSILFWTSYYPPEKVGVLNDNCEKVFGLEPLENTWAWTAFDVGTWQGMNQKQWNLMAEGGLLPIARKRKTAKTKQFDQPGMFASNQPLMWRDTNGEIVRRLFPFFYSKHPGKGNTKLTEDFRKYRLAISLKKICCAYREKYEKYGSQSLGDHNLPSIIMRNLQVIQRATNPLLSFLHDPVVILNKNYYTEFPLFKKSFGEFTTRCNLRNRMLTSDESLLQHTLESAGCSLISDPKDLPGPPAKPGMTKAMTWVRGMCMVELEYAQHHCPPERKNVPLPPLADEEET